jgi:GPH family glycoside/pentoside/hexuronide:cation symporter
MLSAVLWTVFFYSRPGGLLPVGFVTGLVFLGRMVDMVTDPLVGHWSDRFRSRWGRRIPFIVWGAPVMALGFALLWMPPQGLSTVALGGYVVLALSLFFAGHTLSGRPYDALLPEITPDPRERTNLSAYRVAMGVGGAVVGLVVSGVLIDRWGFAVMGAALAALALVTRYTSVAGVWRWTDREARSVQMGILEAMRLTLRNRPFRAYLPSFVLLSVGIGLLLMLLPFFVTEVLDRGEVWVSAVMGVYVAVAVMAVPAVVWLAGRLGRRVVYQRGLLLTGLVMPFLFVVGFLPGVSPLLQVLGAVAILGAVSGALFVFPLVIMADIVDHDETLTSSRREGIYYGVEQGSQKMGIALGTFLFGAILEAFGATAEEPTGLRLIGPVAGVLILIGYAIFRKGYRLGD